MEEQTLVWLPRSKQTTTNPKKVNEIQTNFSWVNRKTIGFGTHFNFEDIANKLEGLRLCPEVEVMEPGPGEETRSGTNWTRSYQSWVLWVSMVRFHYFPCVLK